MKILGSVNVLMPRQPTQEAAFAKSLVRILTIQLLTLMSVPAPMMGRSMMMLPILAYVTQGQAMSVARLDVS